MKSLKRVINDLIEAGTMSFFMSDPLAQKVRIRIGHHGSLRNIVGIKVSSKEGVIIQINELPKKEE